MSENVFNKAKISDEEWSRLQISRLSSRPNAKTAYGSGGYDAKAMKAAFDAQGNMLKEHHNSLVDSLSEIGRSEAERQQAEDERKESYKKAESERNKLYGEAEAARNEAFVAKETERKAEFDASYAEIKAQYDALGVVQTPGNSETQVMSQKATTEYVKDYIPKVASKNLLNVTWKNGWINGSTGALVVGTGIIAAAPEYVAVTGGESYTFSWRTSAQEEYIYVSEYREGYSFIKRSRITRATNATTAYYTMSFDAECAFVRVDLAGGSTASMTTWDELLLDDFQLELGTERTGYVRPQYIDSDEINGKEVAEKYIDALPHYECLPASAWEAGNIMDADGSEKPLAAYRRTKGYIHLRAGDVIISTKSSYNINVYEYDLVTLEHITNNYAWTRNYTVKNDCFVRIKVNMANGGDIETVTTYIQINRKCDERVKFAALPIDKLNELIGQTVNKSIDTKLVTKTKFAGARNNIFRQISHRGFRATGAPECTAPAYIEAKKFGYDVGENDLWVTSDGVFVMAHAATMPSNSSVVITKNTYETLLTCNMGTFNGITIPILTFEEWLILMKKIGLDAFIDLKSHLTAEQAAEAVGIVRKHGMLDKVTWCTSSNITARGIRAVHPTARLALISWTSIQADSDYIIEGRPDLTVLYPQSINVTAEVVENAHNAGVGVECWHVDYSANGFTTEEAILAEVERVLELGVTGICLDTYLPSEYFIEKLNAEWGL